MRKLASLSLISLISTSAMAAVPTVVPMAPSAPIVSTPAQAQIQTTPTTANNPLSNQPVGVVQTNNPLPPAPSAAGSVFQQPGSTTNTPVLNPGAPVLNAAGYFLEDVNSGKVLASQNPDVRMAPASLTKLMTLYLTFEALNAGRIHLNDQVPISVNAWKTGGSRMFVTAGSKVPVSELIQGVIVDSGNDACTALAQYVGGTQASFVNLMNEQAQLLGMKNTHYVDVTGLPDPDHYSTPRDIATLARATILNFPQYYHFFDEKTLTYDNITQPNRNRLLWSDPSVDGLKTGHTSEAGYCLVSSANRNGMRLLSVMLGAPTDADRSQFSENLLNYGYRFFEGHKILTANKALKDVPINFGKEKVLPVGVTHDLYITIPSGALSKVDMSYKLYSPLNAPIKQGQTLGSVSVSLNGKILGDEPVIALQNVQRGGLMTRLMGHLKLMLGKI